ncbi:tripeptide aminopeptidase [Orbus hercynius]|uniref:Peptidase T n=1 Tax=Orbus hercynius TaxID=593135 RepID=A0A495RJF3_9GAMM|nr:peptidase T [Orbus hercynius]RKS87575.1 tripeptide aminopeptidase [Orbus hercynius]
MQSIAQQLQQRFFRYVAVTSQSCAANAAVPSTQGQRTLAKLLASELSDMGIDDIHLDEHSVLIAHVKGQHPSAPKIGFVAHLDTVDVGLSPDIKPQIKHFTGDDVCLNAEQDIWLRVSDRPEIKAYVGDDIIFSDGTSVLGADNKAAVSVIMTLMQHVSQNPAQYGDIYVAFVPDEEIGLRGAKVMDLTRFPVDFAYTIDCCQLGEVVYETFNAASVSIKIKGVTAHPMSAKNVLVNPLRVAHDIISCFDRQDTPEHTEGREGYFYVTDLHGNPDSAEIKLSIRDFDKASYEARKRYIGEVVSLIAARHPKAKIDYQITDVYSNIHDSVGQDRTAIDLIFNAMESLSITPKVLAMRGGTDGSALSARGIFTPNYFTGAHNFHAYFEFLPMQSFIKSYQLTELICQLTAKIDKR